MALAEIISRDVSSFDEFLTAAHGAIPATMDEQSDDGDAFVAAVGYSDEEGRYRGLVYARANDWAPFEVQTMFVFPSPLVVRPSDYEIGLLRKRFAATPYPQDEEFLRMLEANPCPSLPESDAGWFGLACAVRQQRSMVGPVARHRTLIGGRIIKTEATFEQTVQAVLGEFDDDEDSEEFAQLVAGSFHPVALAAPCGCGSGLSWRSCCLAQYLDDPCDICESGKPLGDCCASLPVTAHA